MNNKICICTYLKMSLKKYIMEYKMKNIFVLFTFIISMLLTVYLHGQPDYIVSATNGELVDNHNYEFDIYILSTGAVPLELATFQMSIYFNDAISDSGTLTATYLAGTSTLDNSNQFPNPPNLTFTTEGGAVRQLRIAPKAPPGSGNGSVIADTLPGTKFGRFRITNSYPFDTVTPVNWQWNFTTGLDKYSSYINAYLSPANTNITDPVKFIMELDDPLLPAATFQLSVNVSDGWNMVSVPGVNPDGQGVGVWWSGKDPSANVFKYLGGYTAVTEATPTEGYWMKNAGAQEYNTGDEWPAGGIQIVTHNPFAGALGWNLIGGYDLSVGTAGITTNPPGLQSGPIYKYSGGYQVAATLDPGYGYWMKLTSTGQIILPEVLAKGTESIEYFPEDMGKIVLTDATGINYTLYAVKGETDLSQYELPPAPPTGMFDIRFSSGRIAEDLNTSIKTIELSGITYPLTVRIENMDIRFMDETGKKIDINLKAGEDVVISDATINKLMVTGELLPTVYALEQNYPNPFNPSTTIKFAVPKESEVNLSIFNVLGELVLTLVNEQLKPGYYEYKFNASSLASGVYLYRINAEEFVATKKMILLK